MRVSIVLSGLLTLLCACSGPDSTRAANGTAAAPAAPPAATSSSPATPLQLYTLDCGQMDFGDADSFADDGSMKGVARTLVDPCFLIRHPSKGDLLWDTGVPEEIADSPGGVKLPGEDVHVVVRHKLSAQLAELGLNPADIEFVSFSHLHFDHTGNANAFAAASIWIVDADERAAMFGDPALRGTQEFARYSALETANTLLIEGDAAFDVFGDGSVVIHQAPGHTPGHAVLLVNTAHSGTILLAGDMWHLAESRKRRLVPVFNTDRAMTLESMDKVEALAKASGARVVRQHVPADVAGLPVFPAALE